MLPTNHHLQSNSFHATSALCISVTNSKDEVLDSPCHPGGCAVSQTVLQDQTATQGDFLQIPFSSLESCRLMVFHRSSKLSLLSMAASSRRCWRTSGLWALIVLSRYFEPRLSPVSWSSFSSISGKLGTLFNRSSYSPPPMALWTRKTSKQCCKSVQRYASLFLFLRFSRAHRSWQTGRSAYGGKSPSRCLVTEFSSKRVRRGSVPESYSGPSSHIGSTRISRSCKSQ